MRYLDVEINKTLEKIKYHFPRKNWKDIEIYLYRLVNTAFEQGCYVGRRS